MVRYWLESVGEGSQQAAKPVFTVVHIKYLFKACC